VSSSIASSSTCGEPDPELEMLPRRRGGLPNGEAWVGEEVDKPKVVIDMLRRCWALAAAVAIGFGKAFVGGGDCPALLGREKSPEKAWPGEKEPLLMPSNAEACLSPL